jgi:hypothetical protein
MNPRNLFMLATATLLLACSNPPTVPVAEQPVPPPEISMELPLEPEPRGEEFIGRFCQLGESCLSLDPRPFEACLVGTARCADKITAPLLVGDQAGETAPR